MRIVRRVLYALVALAVLGAVAANLGPNGIACGTVVIRARGRLIDAATGAPVANALVISFPAAAR